MTMPPQQPYQQSAEFERLIRIEAKLDAWNQSQTSHEARSDQIHQDHESRIRRLERSLWLLTGAAATGGGLIGSVLGPVIQQLGK